MEETEEGRGDSPGYRVSRINSQSSDNFLLHFIINYTQPREEPSRTLLERQGATNLEEGWTAFIGRTMTTKEGESEGENRKRRTEEVEPNLSTRTWHRMSNRPETWFVITIPFLALNAYMRRMIQGSSSMFNPLTFVLLPDALTAICRRDK
jgi:hypothetical protein